MSEVNKRTDRFLFWNWKFFRAIRTSIMCSCLIVVIFIFVSLVWQECYFISFTAFLHEILSCNKSNTLELSVIVNAVDFVIIVCLTYLNPIGIITETKTLYTRFSRKQMAGSQNQFLKLISKGLLYTNAFGLFLELYILFGCFRHLNKIMVLLL